MQHWFMVVLTFAQPFQIWVPPTPFPGWDVKKNLETLELDVFNAVLQGTY